MCNDAMHSYFQIIPPVDDLLLKIFLIPPTFALRSNNPVRFVLPFPFVLKYNQTHFSIVSNPAGLRRQVPPAAADLKPLRSRSRYRRKWGLSKER